jgi:hypothetical protein
MIASQQLKPGFLHVLMSRLKPNHIYELAELF